MQFHSSLAMNELVSRYYMVHSEQTHFMTCWNGGIMKNDSPLESIATSFPMPPVVTASQTAPGRKEGKLEPIDLGGISAVKVDPVDGTLWLLCRCGHEQHCFH